MFLADAPGTCPSYDSDRYARAPTLCHPSSMLPPLLIHLIVPAAGLVWYLRLRKRMHSSGVPDAPDRRLFLAFLHYGGWLLVLLTARSSQESAAATAGLMYLLLFAPWLMAGVAVRTFSPAGVVGLSPRGVLGRVHLRGRDVRPGPRRLVGAAPVVDESVHGTSIFATRGPGLDGDR